MQVFIDCGPPNEKISLRGFSFLPKQLRAFLVDKVYICVVFSTQLNIERGRLYEYLE